MKSSYDQRREPPPDQACRLTAALPADLDQIMKIEELSFGAPWSRLVFIEELDRDRSHMVVLRGGARDRILAFIIFRREVEAIYVLNVASHPRWRRRGFARRLMNHAIQAGIRSGVRQVTLEVRRSNSGAQILYGRMGFETARIRRGYYENGEDAMVMALPL